MGHERWRVCAEPSCPELTVQPRCPKHQPKPWGSSTRRQRLPTDWPRRRQRILRRDPICKACDVMPATEVDHVTPNDDHSDTNLQGLCADCHRAKTSRESASARRR
jgi:5-methylcytosine-specific restriction protein A